MSLPPLRSLLAFEAVVRLGGVGRAAAELGVSQPAVSQQLRVIEGYFGRRMVEASRSGVRAEADAGAYAARLTQALVEIRAATDAFQAETRRTENQLTVALLASFAQRWLIPRLADFQAKWPEIDVRLMTTSTPADLLRADADLSIRCGDGRWPGQTSAFLLANRIYPVASPGYLAEKALARTADLETADLIHVTAAPRDRDWPLWLARAGAPDLRPRSWRGFDNSSQALEAATAGLGVAMAHSPFVLDSIASGRLIRLFDLDCPDAEGDYYLSTPRRSDPPRRIRRFRDWLLDRARSEAAE